MWVELFHNNHAQLQPGSIGVDNCDFLLQTVALD